MPVHVGRSPGGVDALETRTQAPAPLRHRFACVGELGTTQEILAVF